MESLEHRRKYPRVPSKNTILVKKLGSEEVEGFAKTEVMGLGGCLFLSDESFGIGTYCDILISVEHNVVKAMGKVVYEEVDKEGRLHVGAEFINISETDRHLLEVLWGKSDGHSA